MNSYEIATLILALRQLQRACPFDTYQQQVAQTVATASLSLVPASIQQLVDDMEVA